MSKVEDALEGLIKSGEGSRGGKVIGHTKTGKPIYSSFAHAGHADFDAHDHRDAMLAHANSESPNMSAMNKHRVEASAVYAELRSRSTGRAKPFSATAAGRARYRT